MRSRRQHHRFLLMLLLALILIWHQAAPAIGAAGSGQQDPVTVLICVLDGCPDVSLSLLPESTFLRRLYEEENSRHKTINAVFPSSTAAGHTAIFTGTYPEENGVTGKEYLDDDGELVRFNTPDTTEVPTLFHMAGSEGFHTAMISAKATVAKRLSDGPDFTIWLDSIPEWVLESIGPPPDESAQYDDYAGCQIETDRWVLRAVEAYLEYDAEPAFIGINLASPDTCGHRFGPVPAEETFDALSSVSEGLEELVEVLEETRPGSWALIITADHGMTGVDKGITARSIISDITDKGVPMTLDGGALYVWADEEDIDEFADVLRQTEGVDEVITVEDKARRAELHIEHARTPSLIAIAERGYTFIEALPLMERTLGGHGTLIDTDLEVPLIVVGPNADMVDLEGVDCITDIRSVVEALWNM